MSDKPGIDPSFAAVPDRDVAASAIAKATLEATADVDAGDSPHIKTNSDNASSTSDAGQEEPEKPELHQGRPVSNTKRAIQNRAAQKAFRERRKARIKQLESDSAQFKDCQVLVAALKKENEHLKDYILALQSKLIDGRILPLGNQQDRPQNGGNHDPSLPM